jgi:2-polyprenyl-3-methyl-5-hydroxy-6-metoxy-1,4-benzoquinol methylase
MNCPVCNHSNVQIAIESQDFSLTQKAFSVLHCNHCSCRFTSPVPNQDEIGQYYKFNGYISHTDTKEGWMNRLYHFVRTKTLADKTKWVQSLFTGHKGHLLDIGAGTGAFAHAMQQKAWNVTGLEPDAVTRDKAFEIHQLHLQSTDTIFDLPENEFEVITMWHVLEHVHTLKSYLNQCFKSLKYNGRLIIAVPNYTSFDAKYYKKYWAAYDLPRHLYHFSPKSMAILLNEMGFEIVSIRPMWYDSFYVSLLSEKYKQSGKLGMLIAGIIGLLSNLFALKHPSNASSVIYEVKKQSITGKNL